MTQKTDARRVALKVLHEIARGKKNVQAILSAALETADMDPRQRGLATELVYGVLRNEILLDWLLEHSLRAPGKTPLRLRLVLRMALYALKFMDRTGPHHTVSAFVEVAKDAAPIHGNIANAVLRTYLRSPLAEASSEAIEAKAGGGLEGLGVITSLPVWILQLWEYGYGDARPYALAATQTPWPCVRVNAAKPDAAALRDQLLLYGEPVGLWGVRFNPLRQPQNLESLLRKGRISRQGAGSIKVVDAIAPHLHGRIWDGCTGFGGKTCALLERGHNVVLASDNHTGRLAGLAEELKRLGLPKPRVTSASATEPPIADADSILLDVPCGGLGTLARRPDLRRTSSGEHLLPLVDLQRRMLDAAWGVLRPGGVLAYVTCALNPRENEMQIADFLRDNEDAALLLEHAQQPDGFGSDLLYGVVLRKG